MSEKATPYDDAFIAAHSQAKNRHFTDASHPDEFGRAIDMGEAGKDLENTAGEINAYIGDNKPPDNDTLNLMHRQILSKKVAQKVLRDEDDIPGVPVDLAKKPAESVDGGIEGARSSMRSIENWEKSSIKRTSPEAAPRVDEDNG